MWNPQNQPQKAPQWGQPQNQGPKPVRAPQTYSFEAQQTQPAQPPQQPYPQQQAPPQLQSVGGQFGGAFQNPQMSPYTRTQQNQSPGGMGLMSQNPWQQRSQGAVNWQQPQKQDPIPETVWGQMGLWNKGGW